MKQLQTRFLTPVIWIGVLAGFLFPGSATAQARQEWVGKVVSVQGSVQVRRAGKAEWVTVNLSDSCYPGDTIRVQARSRAAVLLTNEVILRLDQKTTILFPELKKEPASLLNLFHGAVHFFSRIPRRLKVVTPFVNAAVGGTEFFVHVRRDQTFLSVFEGRVAATNAAGSLTLASGQSALVREAQAPEPHIVVRPRDAVQWALYYPPILDYRPGDFPGGAETDWQAMVRRSIRFYRDGDLTGAFSSLAGAPDDIRDPRFFTYRAGLLLSVGRVDEARSDIDKALNLDPQNSRAFALQAIIAVVQNQKDKALDLAEKAVELDHKSATARVALSYAEQAHFRLEEALKSLQEAVQLNPDNALAWARLAEIRLSVGNLDKAVEAARQAVALNPNLARTQTVLGFAELTRIKTKDAKKAFEKAIELDPATPLGRLGLGLAKIREGDLKEGRGEIEIAASLDPNNALIRSYLGKAYFEEKRDTPAMNQLTIAKELDPLDPTAYFYDAIRKQTVNEPVEALQDLQKSIELNDNRAVYRSRLMLDEDLAARSASLGRIYSDLGFQQLALVEGWLSVNTDPTNFSAHRFLSDSYAALPRREIARVSELLQSQLLQPINTTPIQPTLAETNLFLISSQGPSTPSFNTYNPLFNRNQAALLASGLGGSNSTWGGEGIVSGIYDKLSLSAGYTHFETDGFRINNDQDDDIVNGFAQYELTYQTSIQGEYRYRDTRRGETQLRFLADDFDPSLRQEDETDSIRIGFRHSVSPISVFIGNFGYQNADFILQTKTDSPILSTSNTKSDQNAYGGELGYIFRKDKLNIVSGAGYFNIDVEDTKTTVEFIPGFVLPPPAPPIPVPPETRIETSVVDRDVHHTNLYLYSYFNFLKNVTFTLGASGDLFDSSSRDEKDTDQFNPKFGITWNPVPDTTLRGAVFRVLKRTLIADQTLEPTQVAGFNQFYDDATATDAWNYGIAVDQKITKSIFGGLQFIYRDMKVPFTIAADSASRELAEADWKEKLARAYIFWTPHEWVSLTAEWLWERFERERFAFGAKDVETNYLPFGLNFFHPSGFFAALKGTYVNQKGSFERQFQAGIFEDGEDNFWLADAFIGYRLPKRYGFITVGVTNLFDEEFQHFDTDPKNLRIQPDRSVFARLTLAFP